MIKKLCYIIAILGLINTSSYAESNKDYVDDWGLSDDWRLPSYISDLPDGTILLYEDCDYVSQSTLDILAKKLSNGWYLKFPRPVWAHIPGYDSDDWIPPSEWDSEFCPAYEDYHCGIPGWTKFSIHFEYRRRSLECSKMPVRLR